MNFMRRSSKGEYVTYDELREKVKQLEKERDYYKDLFNLIQGTQGEDTIKRVREFIKLQEKK